MYVVVSWCTDVDTCVANTYICLHLGVEQYIYMCVCVCVCVCVCLQNVHELCVHVNAHMCMCMCMCVHVIKCVIISTRMCTNTLEKRLDPPTPPQIGWTYLSTNTLRPTYTSTNRLDLPLHKYVRPTYTSTNRLDLPLHKYVRPTYTSTNRLDLPTPPQIG
jgi:hypothetical protein